MGLNKQSGNMYPFVTHTWNPISIEPIMDFDLRDFLCMLRDVKPEFVSIGADSKRNNLIEPPSEKIEQLIKHLKSYTNVIIKNNLKRLIER